MLSRITKLRKPGRIYRVEPAPLWASSYTHYLLYKKLKTHSAHADSPIVPKHFFVILCRQFECSTSLCFTDQETQEENLQGETSSLVGQFLHPLSLVQSSRSIQRMQTVQLFRSIFLSCTGNLDVGPVYSLQIKNLRIFSCIFDSLERLFLTLITSYCCDQFCQTSLCLREQKIQGLSER